MARAISPVLGVALFVEVTVASGVSMAAIASAAPAEPPPTAPFELHVDPAADGIAITHVGGDAVPPEGLSMRVTIDGEPLAYQSPVPFFAATGFVVGPTAGSTSR